MSKRNVWPMVNLGEVAAVISGQSPPGSAYRNKPDGMPFFQGKADFGETHPVPSKWCVAPKKIAAEGDILVSVRAPVGPTNVAAEECCIGRGLAAIRANNDVHQEYLRWVFKHLEQHLVLQGSGSTFQSINRKDLLNLTFPLPPLPEQRRIASRLSAQMPQVAAARAASQDRLDAAREVSSSYLRHLFSSERDWPTARLGDLVKTGSGSTPRRSRADYFGGTIPWVKTGELRDGLIEDTEERVTELALEESSLKLLPVGTLLIAMYGQGQTRGRTGLLAIAATTNQACFAILPSTGIDNAYLQVWFRSQYTGLRTLTEGRGGNQPNLNGIVLRDLRVPVPSLDMQQRIVEENRAQAVAISEMVGECRNQLAEIDALPAALLREVFDG